MPNTVLDDIVAGEDFGERASGGVHETPAPAPSPPNPTPDPPGTPAPTQNAVPTTPAPVAPAPAEERIPGEMVHAPAEGQPQQRFVPHGAFHAEREQNKQLRARLAELESRQAPRLTPEELLAIQRQMHPAAPAPAAAPPEPEPPNFLADPKGYIDTNLAKTAQQLEAIKAANAQFAQQQAESARQTELRTTAQYAEMSFVKQTPDYYAALDYGRNARFQQLRLLYPQAPDIGLRQAIAGEELQLAAQAIQTGRNPAEVAYGYIQSLGYKAAAPAPAAPVAPAAPTAAMLAAQTLGASSAADPAAAAIAEPEDPNAEVHAALAEMFGARRK